VVRILQRSFDYHLPYQDDYHLSHEDLNHNYSYLRVIITPELSSLFQFVRCLIKYQLTLLLFLNIFSFVLFFIHWCSHLSILSVFRLSRNLVLFLNLHFRQYQEQCRNLNRVAFQLTINRDRLFRQPINSNPFHFFCRRRKLP